MAHPLWAATPAPCRVVGQVVATSAGTPASAPTSSTLICRHSTTETPGRADTTTTSSAGCGVEGQASTPLAGGAAPVPTGKPSTMTWPAFSACNALSAAACDPNRTLTKSSPGMPEYGGLWQWMTSPNCAIALAIPTRLCCGMMPVVIRTSADMAAADCSEPVAPG
eukprot:CAMPEP_0178432298 /NCGR_PEP_ID=MMETSP0689_2-20121128/32309_1 /TAXON_ID=160604 /ORGANISM="Amphidinium massartii, Strain CS-259" /LENGTH=165 /DNA_ID=CAMNT_0020054273 /DNA_START=251 /DNA_END=746 /DNA_ORIENTATION=+